MYRGLSFAVVAPCLNEKNRIARVVARVKATGLADEIIVVDDGSEDGSADAAEREGATILRWEKSRGVGAALRAGLELAAKKYSVAIVIAGNDKDDPTEIPRLLDPILDAEADFVQGSR